VHPEQQCYLAPTLLCHCWLQVIDTDKGTLQNVIRFPPEGAFVIQAKIELSSNQRVTFDFVEAKFKLPRREIKLPPVGKGWSVLPHMHKRIT